MRKAVLLCSLFSVFLLSCREQKTKRQVEKLLSAAIEVPAEIHQVLFGRDTMLVDVGNSPARLVIYADSLLCSSCRLKYMY